MAAIKDLGWREVVIFTPLVVLTILFGVAPKPVLDMSAASVAQLLDNYQRAITAPKTAAPAHDVGKLTLDFGRDHAPIIIPVSAADESIVCKQAGFCRCCPRSCWAAAPCCC